MPPLARSKNLLGSRQRLPGRPDKERSLAYANETLSDDQEAGFELQNVPAMQVMKDQSAVATAEGDLTVSKATLKLQRTSHQKRAHQDHR